MSDLIEVRGLKLEAIVGVLPHERARPQPLRVDLALWVDTSAAAASDDLADTVDYAALSARVVERCQALQALLLERLTADLVGLCLEDPRVERARVTVQKPDAVPAADWVGVTVERDRGTDRA